MYQFTFNAHNRREVSEIIRIVEQVFEATTCYSVREFSGIEVKYNRMTITSCVITVLSTSPYFTTELKAYMTDMRIPFRLTKEEVYE